VTEGGTDKNHPGENLTDKRPPYKTPRTKTPANNWERICTGGFFPGFCIRPTKNQGVRDVWRTFGGPGMCDKVWQGRGG